MLLFDFFLSAYCSKFLNNIKTSKAVITYIFVMNKKKKKIFFQLQKFPVASTITDMPRMFGHDIVSQ